MRRASRPTTSGTGRKYTPGALECAHWYRELLQKLYGDLPIKYFQSYISLTVGGKARVWIEARKKNNRAQIQVKPSEETFAEVVEELNKRSFGFSTGQNAYINANTDISELKKEADVHGWLSARIAPSFIKKLRSPVIRA